jgi:putative tryptophan/tyrosine transport system substrate-binding protein
MRRREFIKIIGGVTAASTWPLSARAQQPAMPVVGLLSSGAPNAFAEVTTAFTRALSDAGYVAGKNATIEFRWAEGQYDRLPALAADLVRRRVAVIVVAGGEGCDLDHPNCLHHRRRSGQDRSRRKPQPPGR